MTTQDVSHARVHAHLSAVDLVVIRGGLTVLDHLTVTVSPESRLGVVGENGRGKSTFLHALAGRIQPDAGEIRRFGSIGIAEQELPVDDDRTIGDLIDVELSHCREAVAQLDSAASALATDAPGAADLYAKALDLASHLDAWDADRRVDIALLELGAITDRSRLLSKMSVGQRYRVRLACLLGAAHDFLLLDEPTNHLDRSGLDFLTENLRTTKAGVVLVSHDRALLADIATSILDLDPSLDGRAQVYGDGYSGYVQGRQAQRARWQQTFDEHQAEHSRLSADLSAAQNRLQSGWRPPKGTGKHQRATRAPSHVRAIGRRLDDLRAHDVTKPPEPLMFTLPELPELPGARVISAHDVMVEGRLHTPVSVEVASGDRLLITGPNGAGKSTLLAVLGGSLVPTTGSIAVSVAARLGVVSQDSSWKDQHSAFEVYQARVNELLKSGLAPELVVPLGSLGLLRASDASRPVMQMSIGQQRRLDLALALAARPHALLLDEPTNHLSMALVDELFDALDNTPAAVIVVTHDRQLQRDLESWPMLMIGAE